MTEKQHKGAERRRHEIISGGQHPTAEMSEQEVRPEQKAELTVKSGVSKGLRGIDEIEAETVTLVRNTGCKHD